MDFGEFLFYLIHTAMFCICISGKKVSWKKTLLYHPSQVHKLQKPCCDLKFLDLEISLFLRSSLSSIKSEFLYTHDSSSFQLTMGNIFGSSRPKDDNLETFHLIWLDIATDDTKAGEKSRKLLRTSINHFRIFNDKQECENYIQNVSKNARIVFIITGHLGQEMLPHICQLRQISSIYIYCMNKDYHQQWVKDFPKVNSSFISIFFTDI